MRKIERQLSIFKAVATVAFIAAFGAGSSFAQQGGIVNPQQKPAPTNAQLKAGASAAEPQPADPFLERLDQAIEITSKRYLTANAHSPWQIFHSILALHESCQLRLGNEKVNAIEWLSTAEPQFNKQPWMLLTSHGAKFQPYNNILYHFEGHPGQFLALLSESDLPLDHQFKVQGKVVTLSDVVNNTMKEVNSKEEVTWVLWALQHFLKTDASWLNQSNEPWSIEKLVQMETTAPVVGAPCGGNHRLFALKRTVDKYRKTGARLRGVWFEADQKINKHIELARSLQNADGSFSSESYAGRGQTNDINKRFNTSGHTMEFLAIGLPKERLNEPWVRNAVWMLSSELIYYRNNEITAGPLFHTLDALILYRNRIREAAPGTQPAPAPQIANPTPAIPLGTTLKSPPILNSTLDKSTTKPNEFDDLKSLLDAKRTTNRRMVTKNPLTVSETQPKEPKIDSEKRSASNPLSSSPEFNAGQRIANGATPKFDPALLPNVGMPALAPKANSTHLSPQRTVQRDDNRKEVPALLPEAFVIPLVTSESPLEDFRPPSNSADSDSAKSLWRQTSPEQMLKHPLSDLSDDAESPVYIPSDEVASALTPANP